MFNFFLYFAFLQICICICPNGTEQSAIHPNQCFIFVANKSNWINAEGYCEQMGGYLASVSDAFANLFLSSKASLYFTDSTDADFWIGGTNEIVPGQWSWIDGTPFTFSDWKKGQPDNVTAESCAASSITDSLWSSMDCFKTKSFVCIIPPQSTTTTTTTTPPTTTKKVPTCESGWYLFETTGYCYLPKWYESYSWQDAENYCLQHSSHLASIHSQIESDYVADLLRKNSPAGLCASWIGLYTVTDHQSWVWSDGTPYDFAGWSPGEPSNSGGKENCVELMLKNCRSDHMNYWNDAPCNDKINFVCKKSKS